MIQSHSPGYPKHQLSRRSALKAGAAAAIVSSDFWMFRNPARADSIVASKKGITMMEATPSPKSAPITVVLVHGAFADASGWAGVPTLSIGHVVLVGAKPGDATPG